MSRAAFRLALAIGASLLLHILPFLRELLPTAAPAAPPRPAPLQAVLRSPPPAPLPLALDPPPKTTPAPQKAPPEVRPVERRPPPPAPGWQQAVRRQLQKQQADGLFYPAEAIAQGLQGEVEVYMIVDENGRVAAARVENSSGHRLLDDAALRAVRALHGLPADTPRETVLPVRFRLH